MAWLWKGPLSIADMGLPSIMEEKRLAEAPPYPTSQGPLPQRITGSHTRPGWNKVGEVQTISRGNWGGDMSDTVFLGAMRTSELPKASSRSSMGAAKT